MEKGSPGICATSVIEKKLSSENNRPIWCAETLSSNRLLPYVRKEATLFVSELTDRKNGQKSTQFSRIRALGRKCGKDAFSHVQAV
jgi:hypothetical protein